ncbi:MAG: hypothetical protein V4640_16230 [Verrucomicrobiota bacterium]
MTSAHAASVVGTINFSSGAGGGIILQNSLGIATTNFASVTGVKSWSLAKVDSRSGSFMSIPNGQSVSFNTTPWVFNPSTPIAPLWSIAGPDNFSFTLNSSLVVVHTQTFIAVTGTGTLSGNGYLNTPAQWFFATHTRPINGQYVWSSSTVAIPEAGTTTLLAAALCGICLVRRRKAS